MLLAGVQALVNSPAHAVFGCNGGTREQVSQWHQKQNYQHPTADHGITATEQVELQANLIYWACPNGSAPYIVKPKTFDFCWFLPDSDASHVWFDGVRFNAHAYDSSGKENDPPTVIVPDDGTRQNCVDYNIPDEYEKWYQMSADPRWNVWTQIRVSSWDDTSWKNWDTPTRGTKLLDTANDQVLSGWFRPAH